MITPYLRTFGILAAMSLGALLPQAHGAAVAVRWFIMAMLFIVFLGTKFSRESIQRSHLVLLAANIAMAFAAWGLAWPIGGRDLALAAFFAGLTPTASAAPVIVSFLRGRVDYVVTSFVLTNVVIAALTPVLLPLALGRATPEAFAQVAANVGLLVFVPLGLAVLLRAVHPAASAWPRQLSNVSFVLWLATMFSITANASHFVRQQTDVPFTVLLVIAAIAAGICAANFALGALIGGREFRREASQALGQKNNAFTIFLAMSYASPLVALGPTFYVLWHNLWNTWQLHRHHVRGG